MPFSSSSTARPNVRLSVSAGCARTCTALVQRGARRRGLLERLYRWRIRFAEGHRSGQRGWCTRE
eukprot:COSAG06_NODE_4992_length_3803_cov_1.859881_4_plen_65_part_00